MVCILTDCLLPSGLTGVLFYIVALVVAHGPVQPSLPRHDVPRGLVVTRASAVIWRIPLCSHIDVDRRQPWRDARLSEYLNTVSYPLLFILKLLLFLLKLKVDYQ